MKRGISNEEIGAGANMKMLAEVESMKPMSWIPDLNYVIENPFIVCKLLPARQFVDLCKKFDINTSEEQLEQLEKLGIFYPFARVQYPDDVTGFIDIWSQKDHAISWLENGKIWEPSSQSFREWKTFKEGGFLRKNYKLLFYIPMLSSI